MARYDLRDPREYLAALDFLNFVSTKSVQILRTDTSTSPWHTSLIAMDAQRQRQRKSISSSMHAETYSS